MEEKTEHKTKNLEARLEANRRYYAKNKEKVRMQGYYRTAKVWVNNATEIEKLKELISLATSKLSELEKGSTE